MCKQAGGEHGATSSELALLDHLGHTSTLAPPRITSTHSSWDHLDIHPRSLRLQPCLDSLMRALTPGRVQTDRAEAAESEATKRPCATARLDPGQPSRHCSCSRLMRQLGICSEFVGAQTMQTALRSG
eukprot:3356005-Rhodomonas_salina.1